MKNLLLMRAPLKYIQGANALKHFYENIKEFGNNYLFICSNSAYKSTHDLIEESFKDSKTKIIYQIFGGISSVGEINKMREIVRNEKIDVVVGVGGGSAIDTSKATAYYEKKRIAIIPTVCATDAPCTGLSVIYNDDHTFNSYLFYPNTPDFVLVDSLVIANAPTKFLVAGMGDALGTYFEARECYKTSSLSLENGGITLSSLALCKLCYETLLKCGKEAKISCDNHLVTPELEAIIEANTYLSGVGADNGGLCVAHSFYNGVSSL
ncbi:MAG: iron-containing alcohol dehydrogenase, partial [Candidatus Onthovivens sp.]|nr:iron-containing alcohol dehydrogenase [Candidatus Onthovivens sp.]